MYEYSGLYGAYTKGQKLCFESGFGLRQGERTSLAEHALFSVRSTLSSWKPSMPSDVEGQWRNKHKHRSY